MWKRIRHRHPVPYGMTFFENRGGKGQLDMRESISVGMTKDRGLLQKNLDRKAKIEYCINIPPSDLFADEMEVH